MRCDCVDWLARDDPAETKPQCNRTHVGRAGMKFQLVALAAYPLSLSKERVRERFHASIVDLQHSAVHYAIYVMAGA